MLSVAFAFAKTVYSIGSFIMQKKTGDIASPVIIDQLFIIFRILFQSGQYFSTIAQKSLL